MAAQPFDDDTHRALRRRIALEHTIAAVSRQLVVADGDAIDQAIESTLGELARFVGADRAYVFQFLHDQAHIGNTHEWCAAGIESQKPFLQRVFFDPDSLFSTALRAGDMFDVPCVAQLPDTASRDREVLELQGVQSLLAAPIEFRGRCLGFVGFDAVQQPRAWTDEDRSLLWLAIDGIRNSLIRRRDELALRDSEHRLRDLFERTPQIAVQGYNADRRVVFWNQASEVLYGYTAAEALGQRLEALIIPPPMRPHVVEAVRAWIQEGIEIPAGELLLQRKDGSAVPVFSSHVLRQSADGHVEMYCVDIDLTEQKAAQAGMRLAATVFEHASEGIAVVSSLGLIEAVNPALCRATGTTAAQLVGQPIDTVQTVEGQPSLWAMQWSALVDHGNWTGECAQLHASGARTPVLATLSAVREAEHAAPDKVVALYADMSMHKAHEAELQFLATHDALTGLPNRALLHDRLTQALLHGAGHGQRVAVAYIDLDGFKAVNDTHGHSVGDELLRKVSARMRSALRPGDTLARLGGDEFVAVWVDLSGESAVMPVLARLLQCVAAPLQWDGICLTTTASVGVAFGGGPDSADADTLLRQADMAMYQAKLLGKNRYVLFDTTLDREVRLQNEREARFAHALAHHELVLHYQPQVNLRTRAVVGVEALLRWQHPQQGLLPPSHFLPYAERQDLSVRLGEWVIESALTQQAEWMRHGLTLKVSINIAGAHLMHPNFVPRLSGILDRFACIPRDHIVLELLETGALGSLVDVAAVIRACRELGVGMALDDFGTGYSSLSYLKQLPASVLKIDRSFVRDMLHDAGDKAILSSIVLLGQAFGRTVIAEGVETDTQSDALVALGCELAQGYGIARPMPAAALPGWLAQYQ